LNRHRITVRWVAMAACLFAAAGPDEQDILIPLFFRQFYRPYLFDL